MLPSFFVLLYPLVFGGLLGGAPSAGAWILAQVWPWVGMSVIWTLMTQTSHVQEACQVGEGGGGDCWTAGQVSTALDYSVGQPLATALTAGLNNQGMHHAMPAVSMAHFPDMYDEYEAICRRHGVEPRQTRDLASASAEMFECAPRRAEIAPRSHRECSPPTLPHRPIACRPSPILLPPLQVRVPPECATAAAQRVIIVYSCTAVPILISVRLIWRTLAGGTKRLPVAASDARTRKAYTSGALVTADLARRKPQEQGECHASMEIAR